MVARFRWSSYNCAMESSWQALRHVFVADIHLTPKAPERTVRFARFLEELTAPSGNSARKVVASGKAAPEKTNPRYPSGPVRLYVLGDLFDYWLDGCRGVHQAYQRELTVLEEAARRGVSFSLLFGNRDFTYGEDIEQRLCAEVLGEEATLSLGAGPQGRLLVMHGDVLLSADWEYQCYRRLVRSRPARFVLRLMPWFLAKGVIEAAWRVSEWRKKRKPEAVFCFDLARVGECLARTGARLLLCGHLHSEQRQGLTLPDGAPGELVVLGAWSESGHAFAEWRNDRLEIKRWEPPGGE